MELSYYETAKFYEYSCTIGYQNLEIWPYNYSASIFQMDSYRIPPPPNSKFYFLYINVYMIWPQVICQGGWL